MPQSKQNKWWKPTLQQLHASLSVPSTPLLNNTFHDHSNCKKMNHTFFQPSLHLHTHRQRVKASSCAVKHVVQTEVGFLRVITTNTILVKNQHSAPLEEQQFHGIDVRSRTILVFMEDIPNLMPQTLQKHTQTQSFTNRRKKQLRIQKYPHYSTC